MSTMFNYSTIDESKVEYLEIARSMQSQRGKALWYDFYRRAGVPVTAIPVSARMTAAEMLDGLERAIREG